METPSYFLPYQNRWLKDDSQIKYWEKSRRIGATYVQAYEDVRDCVLKKYFRPNRPLAVWFSSADLSSAKEYIVYCQEFAKLFNDIAKDLGEIILDEKKDIKALCIEFKNGARIYALSSNPSQFRSKGGKVILDEFSHHDQQKALWKAAFASAKIWGYPIRVLSTHNGQSCLFFKTVEKIKAGKLKHSLHTTPIQLAVDEGLADKTCDRKLTKKEREEWLEDVRIDAGNEADWLEEFCCLAIDEATAFLSYELIQSCEVENVLTPLKKVTSDLYVGFDVARRTDLSVIAGLEKLGDVKYLRQLKIMAKTLFRVQRDVLYGFLGHPKMKRSCIDSTGLGMQLAEDAQLDYGKTRVEAITFTSSSKEEMAFALLRAFQDRTIRIPSDPELREDLHSIRKITAGNNIRFDVNRSDTDGHADRFWALALANYAITESLLTAKPPKTGGKRKSREVLSGY